MWRAWTSSCAKPSSRLLLLVERAQLLLGQAFLDRLLHQELAQDRGARLGQRGLDRRVVADVLPLGLVGEQAEVDHAVEQHAVQHLHRHLAHLVGQPARRRLDLGAMHRRAVDGRDDRIVAGARLLAAGTRPGRRRALIVSEQRAATAHDFAGMRLRQHKVCS